MSMLGSNFQRNFDPDGNVNCLGLRWCTYLMVNSVLVVGKVCVSFCWERKWCTVVVGLGSEFDLGLVVVIPAFLRTLSMMG